MNIKGQRYRFQELFAEELRRVFTFLRTLRIVVSFSLILFKSQRSTHNGYEASFLAIICPFSIKW